MSPARKRRRRPPTVSDIRKLRTDFMTVSQSLHDARIKAKDLAERGRIDRALEEINKRVGGLRLATKRIDAMRARQESYTRRIGDLEQRIAKGRSFRGGSRWLRRWRNL